MKASCGTVLGLFIALGVLLMTGGAAAQLPPAGCPPTERGQCFVSVAIFENSLQIYGFSPNATARFEIYDGAGTLRFGPADRQTDAQGNVWITREDHVNPGHHLDLVGGHRVVVTDVQTSTVKTLVVSPVAIRTIDETADKVSGVAAPAERVRVIVDPPTPYLDVVADAAGAWTADFGAVGHDIRPASRVDAIVEDADWDVTYNHPVGCPTHYPKQCMVSASIENDSISVLSFTPSSDVVFEVFDSGGQRVYGPVTKQTDSLPKKPGNENLPDGFYYLKFGVEPGPDLVAGYSVVVTDVATSVVKRLELIALSLDRVDPVSDVVEGSAPADTTVEVASGLRQLHAVTKADASGKWRVDFSVPGVESTDWFGVVAGDEDSDETRDELGAPLPDCKPGAGTVCGSTGPDTLRTSETKFTSAAARDRKLTFKSGPADDTVLAKLRASTARLFVDVGGGIDEGVVLDPGSRRGPAKVVIRGKPQKLTVVLPAHAGKLSVQVFGTKGPDRVITRAFRRRGRSSGGYLIVGGAGADFLKGGDGRDTLIGGPGRDTCFKGRGDTVRSCEIVRRGA